jgi:hypothetical protein
MVEPVVGFTLATHGLAGEIVLCARDGEYEAARGSQQRAAMDALDIKHAIAVTPHRLGDPPRRALAPDRPDDLEAVRLRHVHVQDHHVENLLSCPR